MNIEKLKKEWFPIGFKNEIKEKPIQKKLLGIDLVLVKLDNEICCFEDRCPHRNVPLSNGIIKHKEIQCNYHGWCFNKEGRKNCGNISIKKYDLKVSSGIIWIKLSEEKKEFIDYFSNDLENILSFKIMKSDFIHSIENFLDPIHTSYIHKGLLRSSGQQKMEIEQESNENSFKTIYNLLDKQNGLINKLFDKGINKNIASFIYPGFAKIEYIKKDKTIFEVSIFFIPIEKGIVGMFIQVSLIKTIIPSTLKFLALKPFLELAFKQDKEILEIQYNCKKNKYISTEEDLVIEHLIYLFSGGLKGKNKKIVLSI